MKPTSAKLVFTDSKRAIPHLRARTGIYCHLCGMAVNNQLSIEHIKSQSVFKKLIGHWDNFLLSCTRCNSRKKVAQVLVPYRQKYIWPHLHNPLIVYEVPILGPDFGKIRVRMTVAAGSALAIRAQRTIDLYQLDRETTQSGSPDYRFVGRVKAIGMAAARLVEYVNGQATVQAIVDMAKTTGYFDVWYEIFKNVPMVLDAMFAEPEFCLNAAWFNINRIPVARIPLEGV